MDETLILVGIVLTVLGGLVAVYGIASNVDFWILVGGVVGALGIGVALAGFYLVVRGMKAALKKVAMKLGA